MTPFIILIVVMIIFAFLRKWSISRLLYYYQYFPESLYDEILMLNAPELYIDKDKLFIDGEISCIFDKQKTILFPIKSINRLILDEYSQIETISEGYKYRSFVESRLSSLKEKSIVG